MLASTMRALYVEWYGGHPVPRQVTAATALFTLAATAILAISPSPTPAAESVAAVIAGKAVVIVSTIQAYRIEATLAGPFRGPWLFTNAILSGKPIKVFNQGDMHEILLKVPLLCLDLDLIASYKYGRIHHIAKR